MKLSVVVGTFNRIDQLRACLASILEQTRCGVRVYVADAGSTDGTVEHLRSIASERIVPVLAGKKLGQARAYNEVFLVVADYHALTRNTEKDHVIATRQSLPCGP
jgi:glycosyltransferase involved in cell wall biosynthesis